MSWNFDSLKLAQASRSNAGDDRFVEDIRAKFKDNEYFDAPKVRRVRCRQDT